MKPKRGLKAIVLPLLLAACSAEEPPPPPAPTDTAAPELQRIAERVKAGKLGVAMLDLGEPGAMPRGFNLDAPMPMQSVFKLPLGIFVLHKADRGELSLDDTITLTRADLSIAHSPVADRFDEKQDYTIEELVRAAVAQSDNTAADVLLKRVGGPEALTAFFNDPGFRVDRYEYELQPQAVGLPAFAGQWIGLDAFFEAQKQVPAAAQEAAMTLYLADPRDRMTPQFAVRMLARLARGELLSAASTDKMMEILRSTTTGADRLKAGVPDGAVVYHKTGTGPDVEGVNSASNDIGIIELTDGRRVAVAVFLSGSELPPPARAEIFADVARLATAELARPAAVP